MTFEQRAHRLMFGLTPEPADRPRFRDVVGISPIDHARPDSTERLTLHILAARDADRAHLARLVFSGGHHAEVYSDLEELLKHKPVDGVLIVRDGNATIYSVIMQKMEAAGMWLPVIGFCDELNCDFIVAGIKAGALDFIMAPLPVEELTGKLRSVDAQGRLIRSQRHGRAVAKQAITALSQRERQVLEMLATGASNKEMARRLDISPRTVEIHRMKMMGKLGAKSAAQAIRMELACLA